MAGKYGYHQGKKYWNVRRGGQFAKGAGSLLSVIALKLPTIDAPDADANGKKALRSKRRKLAQKMIDLGYNEAFIKSNLGADPAKWPSPSTLTKQTPSVAPAGDIGDFSTPSGHPKDIFKDTSASDMGALAWQRFTAGKGLTGKDATEWQQTANLHQATLFWPDPKKQELIELIQSDPTSPPSMVKWAEEAEIDMPAPKPAMSAADIKALQDKKTAENLAAQGPQAQYFSDFGEMSDHYVGLEPEAALKDLQLALTGPNKGKTLTGEPGDQDDVFQSIDEATDLWPNEKKEALAELIDNTPLNTITPAFKEYADTYGTIGLPTINPATQTSNGTTFDTITNATQGMDIEEQEAFATSVLSSVPDSVPAGWLDWAEKVIDTDGADLVDKSVPPPAPSPSSSGVDMAEGDPKLLQEKARKKLNKLLKANTKEGHEAAKAFTLEQLSLGINPWSGKQNASIMKAKKDAQALGVQHFDLVESKALATIMNGHDGSNEYPEKGLDGQILTAAEKHMKAINYSINPTTDMKQKAILGSSWAVSKGMLAKLTPAEKKSIISLMNTTNLPLMPSQKLGAAVGMVSQGKLAVNKPSASPGYIKSPQVYPSAPSFNFKEAKALLEQTAHKKAYEAISPEQKVELANLAKSDRVKKLLSGSVTKLFDSTPWARREKLELPTLTAGQKKVATSYTGSLYGSMNSKLRAGDYDGTNDKNILAFDEALANPANRLKEDTLLVRGTDRKSFAEQLGFDSGGMSEGDFIAAVQKNLGKQYTDKGFMSTSFQSHGSESGVAGFIGQGKVNLRILAPKGTPAMKVAEFSKYKHSKENEVILDRGSKMVVTDAYQLDGKMWFDVVLAGSHQEAA